ncbi:MAG: GNAT family N-acetyltransferase [Pseudomonadota bacterium]
MDIETASPDHATAIARLAEQAFDVWTPRIGRRPAPIAEDFPARIEEGRVRVLRQDGVMAGYAVVTPSADGFHIDAVAVDPARQGQGLGRRFLSHLEAEARARRAPRVTLQTNAEMDTNIAFYLWAGYAETGRVVEDGFRRINFEKALG